MVVCLIGCIAGCDFDDMDDLCGWVNDVSDPDIFGWEFWAGNTETPGTGPDDDFSKPGCKYSVTYRICNYFYKKTVKPVLQ